jgi:TolB-like protein/DNA-binding winged helix-turn-helix (wHTH) protein
LSMVYRFGEFRLDYGRYELLRADHAVRLERKPMELLVLFASRQGELVTRTEIAERLWSSEIYVDTEHGINTAVRKLRQLLRDDPAEPKFIQTVTGLGYRFVATVETEPSLGSWPTVPQIEKVAAEAATESSVAVDTATRETAAPRTRSFRFLWLAGLAAVATLVATVLVVKYGRSSSPTIASLAVLPLDNLSGDASQEYFADGMTDELTTMLARDSNLRITSRTSVMQYKGARRPLKEIARSLGVDSIVEGSLSRQGDQMHMTLQLVRADNDSHLWAQSYNRSGQDTNLADEAAAEIAKQLHSTRTAIKATHPVNPAAHDAYLRGKFLWIGHDMEKSGPYFVEATRIQPDYAAAWAGLADYYGEGVAGDVLDPRTSLRPLEEAARRSLELDPNLAEAHQAMAAFYLIGQWDATNAGREIEQAIRLEPQNAELYYLRSCVRLYQRRYSDALEDTKRSTELAPLDRPGSVAAIYSDERQYDAALEDLRLRREADPNNPDLLFLQMDVWRRKGNWQQAESASEKWQTEIGDARSAADERRAWQQGGARGFIQEEIKELQRWAKGHYLSPVWMAQLHAELGEKDATLALLEEGFHQQSADVRWIEDDPAFDFLQGDARYESLLRQIGRPLPSK